LLTSSIAQSKRIWRLDKLMRNAGWPPGRYTRLFYRCRLCNRFPGLFRPYQRLVTMHGGSRAGRVRIRLRIDAEASDLSVLSGVFGEREYWYEGLPHVKTILDLGSNIGCTALWFSLVADSPSIVCVEADPRNYPLLQENLRRNAVNARAYSCAVAANPGQARFSFGQHAGCGTLAGTGMHGHVQTVSVTLKTIPMLLDEAGWPRVDLVKMDVEGTELELFQAAADWLPRTGAVVLEIHPNTSPEEIHGLAAPFGFSIRRIGFQTEPTYLLEREARLSPAFSR
jgi:FkbM family methyltransferase